MAKGLVRRRGPGSVSLGRVERAGRGAEKIRGPAGERGGERTGVGGNGDEGVIRGDRRSRAGRRPGGISQAPIHPPKPSRFAGLSNSLVDIRSGPGMVRSSVGNSKSNNQWPGTRGRGVVTQYFLEGLFLKVQAPFGGLTDCLIFIVTSEARRRERRPPADPGTPTPPPRPHARRGSQIGVSVTKIRRHVPIIC